ncbi:MAG: HD domain-containing protein [Methylovirgula sp.]
MDDPTHQSQTPGYDYVSPINLASGLPPLLKELISTAAFRRLTDVRFLGGIDYLLVPTPNGARTNVRYTRYQHSLGVALLALFYADLKGLSERGRQLAYAAAILHDIGHAPLSHSLEPVFEEAFGFNHHQATKDIVRGQTPLGKDVRKTLENHHLDPDHVLAIIDGDDDQFDGFFAGPINFDTIEGVLRSRRYLKPNAICPQPTDVVRAATLRQTSSDRQLVDAFWTYKNEIYRFVIRSRDGILTDHLCQRIARGSLNRLSKHDFLTTEKSLFKKLPELRVVLQISRSAPVEREAFSELVRYKERNFFIDAEADFFARDDKRRYRQSKQDRVLPASNSAD